MYMDVVTYNYMFIPYLYIIFCVNFAYFQMPYSKKNYKHKLFSKYLLNSPPKY
jgi:hypothetical protein